MKRVTLFCGHYGSGKTNIAINYAHRLLEKGLPVSIGDLDVVNPYFRTKDSAAALAEEGIGLVVSPFANSNVDFPALPKEIYALVADRSTHVVMDVGGDDRGALALGRWTGDILAEGDYDMLAVVNASRPLTRTPADAVATLREIEAAAGIPFTGVVNNTNLGQQTRPEDVAASVSYAQTVADTLGVQVRFTCCDRRIAAALEGKVPDLFPLDIQRLYYFVQ
jgi:hypothetical protein